MRLLGVLPALPHTHALHIRLVLRGKRRPVASKKPAGGSAGKTSGEGEGDEAGDDSDEERRLDDFGRWLEEGGGDDDGEA